MNPFPSAVIALVLLCVMQYEARAFTVFKADESAKPRIFLKANADAVSVKAAQELALYLSRMSGLAMASETVESSQNVPSGSGVLAIGELARELGLVMEGASRARDGFRYQIVKDRLLIAGETPRGDLHGVYDLLERLGCGWFAPGKVGEVVPVLNEALLPDNLDYTGLSDSVNRRFWYGGKGNPGDATSFWLDRNKAEYQQGSWSHAWHGLVAPKELFPTHPEYFSLNRGKRTTKQLCTTNAETVRVATDSLEKQMAQQTQRIFAAGPNDGGNLCECEQCSKLDTPGYREPTSGFPACADRVFGFANELAARTAQKFPNNDLGILVYSEYSRPPLKMQKLHPNVFPMLAPIRRCRFHGPNNPVCESSQLFGSEITDWGKLSSKLGFYAYNYNLADALLPLSKISYYKRLAAALRGANPSELAWIFESIDAWSSHAPHFYLCARLAWNSRIDVDVEMERYFSGFYAESAIPMRRYWLRLDAAYDQTPVHVGSQYGMHRVWTPELLAQSRTDLNEALRLAQSERVKEAVAMAEAGLRTAEIFIKIWNAIAACEFVEAAQQQANLKGHIDGLLSHSEPNWIHERYAWGYYTRFLGLTVDAGAAALSDGGQRLARLPEEWRFKQDKNKEGALEKWWDPKLDDTQWQSLRVFSRSWSDYGLADYHGDLWYRTKFSMPQQLPEGDLRLWFGGFDYDVEVFLNGQRLGGWMGFAKPAEFTDIGKHLRPGENDIAVRVSAGDLGELGTGGLMMPVMVYKWNGKSVVPSGKKGVEYIQ